ncbi:MAG: acyclic terpene utilization AtuA family protein [Salinirussus sp.]
MDDLSILSPLGMLGYGLPEDSLERARSEFDLDVIAVDGGSIDPGPNYLGRGVSFVDEGMLERDLRLLVNAALEDELPFLVGTAGGSGSSAHLDAVMTILDRVLTDIGREADVVRINTDVEPELVMSKVTAGETSDLGMGPATKEDIDAAERIVAQVGVTPFIDALERGGDIVIGGRSSDLSPFAALPLQEGFDPGLTYHLAKILECGARATTASSGNDALVGVLDDDGFEVVPPNPERRCTVESVAAHTLYEKGDPTTIRLPEGEVDVGNADFAAVNDRRVRVSGSTFSPSASHSVLIEGVRKAGYRTVTPAGIRDPQIVDRLEDLAEETHERVRTMADVPPDSYTLNVRAYGTGGATLFPADEPATPEECGVIIDAVGETQEIADTVCGFARSSLLHLPFEGRVNAGGNLAFPFSPSDISVGSVYTLCLYHLLEDIQPDLIPEIRLQRRPGGTA